MITTSAIDGCFLPIYHRGSRKFPSVINEIYFRKFRDFRGLEVGRR
jgi:hypothetical protein